MRAYYLAIVAGALLGVSAFLPWVLVGDTAVRGVPQVGGFWILGLGVLAIVLASLSLYTRKNSRHPLLLIGLMAASIMVLSYGWMERSLSESLWARSNAIAIRDDVKPLELPPTSIGTGIYLGMAASVVLVLFGLTIVIKRASSPYIQTQDDDV